MRSSHSSRVVSRRAASTTLVLLLWGLRATSTSSSSEEEPGGNDTSSSLPLLQIEYRLPMLCEQSGFINEALDYLSALDGFGALAGSDGGWVGVVLRVACARAWISVCGVCGVCSLAMRGYTRD